MHHSVENLAAVLDREGAKGKGFNEIVEELNLKLYDPFLIYFRSKFGRTEKKRDAKETK